MVAAARSAVRLTSRMAAMTRPAVATRPTALAFAQRAFLSGSTAPRKSEVIKETEIPMSVYSPDSKGVASSNTGDHLSIPVQRGPPVSEPAAEEANEKLTPLTEEVYAKMPATLQKMTVMGKVIIITGYVLDLLPYQ